MFKQFKNSQAKPFNLMGLAFVMCLILAGCQEQISAQNDAIKAQAEPVNNDASFTILAIGDSLTEGLGVRKENAYPAVLQDALHQQGRTDIKVINSGLSGETSSGLSQRLDWALKLKPDLTIVNIGANDAMRGLPLELTSKNIADIITRVQASGSHVILAGMQIYDNLGREYVVGFKDMYPQLADQHNVPLIPFFLEHVAGQTSLNQADMIHPNAAGYQVIVQRNVLPVVTETLQTIETP